MAGERLRFFINGFDQYSEVVGYLPIDGATEETYIVTKVDAWKYIKAGMAAVRNGMKITPIAAPDALNWVETEQGLQPMYLNNHNHKSMRQARLHARGIKGQLPRSPHRRRNRCHHPVAKFPK